MSETIKEHALADRIPFWHFDGDTAVFEDGSLGLGFALDQIDIGCASNDEINRIAAGLEGVLKTAAAGLRMQIFYRMTSDAEHFIRIHEETSEDCHDGMGKIRDARIRHLKGRKWRVPEIHFFVRSRPLAFSKGRIRDFFGGGRKFESVEKERYRVHFDRFHREVDALTGALAREGLRPLPINPQYWFELLYEYFNPERARHLSPPVLRDEADPFSHSLASQMLLTDLFDSKEGVRIGKCRLGNVSMKTLPEGVTVPGMVERLNKSVTGDFLMVQNIEIPGQSGALAKLQAERRVAASMAAGSSNVGDMENESKLEKLEEVVSEVIEGRERIVRSDLNIVVMSEDGKMPVEKCDEVLAAFRDMNGAEGLVEAHASLEAFLGHAPGVCEGLRTHKLKSGNCAHLMPIYGPGEAEETPVCLLSDGNGSPRAFDPFDWESENYNALIFGGSGSGKSFLVLQLMMMLSGQSPPPKIIWIDNGASSRRLLNVADGQFVELSLESGIRLNLFDLPKGEDAPSPSKLKLLLAAVEIMLADGERGNLPKLEKALLEDCLCEVYRGDGTPSLGKLRRILEDHPDPRMREHAKILGSWTGDSPHGRLLDGDSNIDMGGDLVTIEIRGLDDHPDLQRIMLLALTDYIRAAAAGDSSRRTLLIIDEAWRLFEAGSGRAFAIEAYRTFRKFGGGAGIWCISQNYRDFLADAELADAILPNTANVLILKQKGIDWGELREKLQLNDRELEIVKNLETEKGAYAEFFLMKGEKRGVMRLHPDPLSYWIATTDADDNRRIEEKERENPELSTLEVLEALAEE